MAKHFENPRRDILAVYSLEEPSHREHFAGILDYLADKPNIRLHTVEPQRGFAMHDVTDGFYDGFIVSLPGSDRTMSALADSTIPTVLVNIDARHFAVRTRNLSCVWLDNADIGRCGAEHLLSAGRFSSYGFVSSANGQFYNRERETAFRSMLRSQGHDAKSFSCPSQDAIPGLAKWIAGLAKPAAIMAADAPTAHLVLHACRRHRMRIPQSVALLSVDLDLSLLNKSRPTVSSVVPDYRKMGYLAARALDRMLNGRHAEGLREIVIPTNTVLRRKSTILSTSSADSIDNALAFIHAHATQNIRPMDVVRHLGCSRRSIETKFAASRQGTILAAIETARIGAAKKMFERHMQVGDVAAELHFRSANALGRIFSRHCGMTVTEFKTRAASSGH